MRPFGELESTVMEHLWSADRALTVRDVLSLIDRDPPLAYTTVLTVMDNLHKKGYLQREREGRAFRYWPTKDRAEHTAALMHQLLGDGGDRSATLLRFIDRMSAAEIKRLKRVLSD